MSTPRRTRLLASAAALACGLVVSLTACTDVVEEPAPAPSGGAVTSEQKRPEEGGGGGARPTEPVRPTSRTTGPPTTRPTTVPPTYPTSCPPGLVC